MNGYELFFANTCIQRTGEPAGASVPFRFLKLWAFSVDRVHRRTSTLEKKDTWMSMTKL